MADAEDGYEVEREEETKTVMAMVKVEAKAKCKEMKGEITWLALPVLLDWL